MTTGERIRARRKEMDLSVNYLADKVGVSRTTIIRYENGYIEKMPIERLVPIAHTLNTTIAYLMGWDEEKQPASGTEDGVESEAMRYFEALPEDRKLDALNYLRFLAENKDKK